MERIYIDITEEDDRDGCSVSRRGEWYWLNATGWRARLIMFLLRWSF